MNLVFLPSRIDTTQSDQHEVQLCTQYSSYINVFNRDDLRGSGRLNHRPYHVGGDDVEAAYGKRDHLSELNRALYVVKV